MYYKYKIVLLITYLFVAAMMGMIMANNAALKEYNKHVCAVHGKYEDCKTPLPEELRLK